MASKDLVIGDMHFGRKNNSRERHSDTMLFVEKFLLPLAKKVAASSSEARLVLTGDLSDSKQVIETFIANDMYDSVKELSTYIPVDGYVGNHDLFSRVDGKTYSTMKPFTWMPGVRMHEEYFVDEKTDTAFLPFYKSKTDELNFIEQCEASVIYTHTEYSGFWYENKMIEESLRSIKPEAMVKFKRVINGHIHGKQVQGNILIVGTPYQLKYAEYKNTPHVHIYDHATNKVQSIENKFSPKFKIFHFFNFLDKTVSEATEEVTNNYGRIITPGEFFEKIDVNKIIGCLSEAKYKELGFDPVRSVNRDDIPQAEGEEELRISSVIDIRLKYESYIFDQIQINGALIDDDLRNRLTADFREMYTEAEQNMNVNDLEFS